jgi:hypothetical protein
LPALLITGAVGRWKREQQLSGNGVPMQSNLNTIQEWCELLADLIWTSRQQVTNVARINNKTIPELRQPHLIEMLDDMSKQVRRSQRYRPSWWSSSSSSSSAY